MPRKMKPLILALVLLLAFGQAAQAALQVGPINPAYQSPAGNVNSSFPAYYMDDQGVALALLPITGDGLNAPTQIYTPKDPASPYSNLLGFESEAFYYFARSIFNTKNGKATASFGLEASFVNGLAVPGEEMVFVRIRLKCPVRDVGTYTLTHPWGVETIVVSQADITSKKGISFTRDVGLVPRAFDLAANGPIQRYVKQLLPAPPAGWIGDGASVGTITPGPYLAVDYVKLTGPPGTDLDGKRNNFVLSNQFTVSGRVAGQLPSALNVQRATCFDLGGVEYIDVFASSDPTATVTVSGSTVVGTPTLTGDGTGKFYGHVQGTGLHGTGPFPITVTATTPGAAPTSVTANVVDNINISSATYSLTTHLLSVSATSTDGAAILSLTGFLVGSASGPLTYTSPAAITIPPATVTVTSSMGGSDTQPVQIINP